MLSNTNEQIIEAYKRGRADERAVTERITPTIGTIVGEQRLAAIIAQAAGHNRKIAAIKAYRDLTGKGLRESKDDIEDALNTNYCP